MSSSARPTGSALLERDGELARVPAALGQARDRGGSLVVVEGPAGMGKKAVLRGSRAIADARDMRALGGRSWSGSSRSASSGNSSEPMLANASAVERRGARRFAEGCGGFAAQALGLPGAPRGTLEESASRADGRSRCFTACTGCANLASGPPLHIVVDDAHRADAPSLRYLAFLLPRLEQPRWRSPWPPAPTYRPTVGVARSDHWSWRSPTSWIRVVR
jgi:predicted ATPase